MNIIPMFVFLTNQLGKITHTFKIFTFFDSKCSVATYSWYIKKTVNPPTHFEKNGWRKINGKSSLNYLEIGDSHTLKS